jgi:glyoxylase-like metal-dependent hydrolase (beta-lactamase superfamily II)
MMVRAERAEESAMRRRDFLWQSTGCAAHLALAASLAPVAARRLWAQTPLGAVVAREPFGRLERIADGIWALISTPLEGDRTTLCNGGIVQGRAGVLAIEGFMQPQGAQWLATKARELTGRWPTHVMLSHYHADHANGVAGYRAGEPMPVIRCTETTRDLVLAKNQPADEARADVLRGATLVKPADESIDLGGRTVRILQHQGHTASDIAFEVEDPSVVFCGDLVWNHMFPNYVDAMPGRLNRSVKALQRREGTVYVPGHGALADARDFGNYVAMLLEVENAARQAHTKGQSAEDAAATFALPAALGEWTLFNKTFYERSFAASYRELQRP